jgi:hypothetical protein
MKQATIAAHGFVVGDRVEIAPHTDTWMRGDRYGTVAALGRRLVAVKFDRSGRTMNLHPSVLTFVAAGS